MRLLVTFNVPLEDPEHADHAVKAAIDIQVGLRDRTFAGIPLTTRIGINTGQVIAGNVGSGDRMNYTVHGDAVNVAARLEQLNKERGTRVLVSGNTVEMLRDTYALQRLGDLPVRGKSATLEVYSLDA